MLVSVGVVTVGATADVAGLLSRLKVTPVLSPPNCTSTTYDPEVALAVKAGAVAKPLESVVTVTFALFPAKLPLAPLAGAAKVTCTPDRLAEPSPLVTWICRAVVKAEPALAVCPSPCGLSTPTKFAGT